MRAEMAHRLIEEYLSPKAAADAVWVLARENEWYREGERAERYLLSGTTGNKQLANKAALDFIVAWHAPCAPQTRWL